MLWRIEHLRNFTRLNDLAVFHHQHVVRHRTDHVDVVGDQKVAQPALALQPLQQLQHLLLDRHVQCARGFVQYQQPGLHDQGACHGNPLALPA